MDGDIETREQIQRELRELRERHYKRCVHLQALLTARQTLLAELMDLKLIHARCDELAREHKRVRRRLLELQLPMKQCSRVTTEPILKAAPSGLFRWLRGLHVRAEARETAAELQQQLAAYEEEAQQLLLQMHAR